MEWRYQFESDAERDELIVKNTTLYLIREENITEGNFLTFSDKPLTEPAVYVNVPQEDFDTIRLLESESTATQAALASTFEALIQSQHETTTAQLALADVYEQLVNMRAELDALKGGDV